MILKTYLTALTKSEISQLRGGVIHNHHYFIAISQRSDSDVFTDVVYAKLRNQMATQKSSGWPEGFEPFETNFGPVRFDIASGKIPVPCLVSDTPRGGVARLKIELVRRPACIINPRTSTDAFELLAREAKDFKIRHRIRQHAKHSPAQLQLLLSLMEFAPYAQIRARIDERFEAYLSLHQPEYLRNLLGLLDMPDPAVSPSKLEQAA
jgi:hypothetical protein